MELVECKPYAARITERACGLRAQKARILAKRPWPMKSNTHIPPLGLVEVEKCLTCPDARAVPAGAICGEDGCQSIAANNGFCARHAPKPTKKEETMAKTDKACKQCGAVEGRLYKGLCAPCRKSVPKTVDAKKFKAVKPFTPTDTQAANNNILSILKERAAELKGLLAAAQVLKDIGGLDIKVPTIEELLR